MPDYATLELHYTRVASSVIGEFYFIYVDITYVSDQNDFVHMILYIQMMAKIEISECTIIQTNNFVPLLEDRHTS